MQQRTSFHFCLSFFFVACLQDMWVFGGGGGVKKVRRWRCRWTGSLWKNQFRKIVTLGHKNYSTKVVIIIIYALTCNNVVLCFCFCLFFLLSSLQTAVTVVYQSRYYVAFVYYVIYVCFFYCCWWVLLRLRPPLFLNGIFYLSVVVSFWYLT